MIKYKSWKLKNIVIRQYFNEPLNYFVMPSSLAYI